MAHKNGEEDMDWLVQVVPYSFQDRPVQNLPSLSRTGIAIPSLALPQGGSLRTDGQTEAVGRISMPVGTTEVLADDGKHDLAPVLS